MQTKTETPTQNPFQHLLDHLHAGGNPEFEVLKQEVDRTLKKALELAELVQRKDSSGTEAQTAKRAIREILQKLLQEDKEEQFTIQDLLQRILSIDSSSPVAKLLKKLCDQLGAVKDDLLAFKQQLDIEEASRNESREKCRQQQLTLALNIQGTLTRIADELTHELFVELRYYNLGLCCPSCKKNYVTIQEESLDTDKAYTYTCHSCGHSEPAFGIEELERVRAKWVVAH